MADTCWICGEPEFYHDCEFFPCRCGEFDACDWCLAFEAAARVSDAETIKKLAANFWENRNV